MYCRYSKNGNLNNEDLRTCTAVKASLLVSMFIAQKLPGYIAMSYVLVHTVGQIFIVTRLWTQYENSMEYHFFDLCRRTSLKAHFIVFLWSFAVRKYGV